MYETFDNEFTWRAHLHYHCKSDLPADLTPESLKRELEDTKKSEFAADFHNGVPSNIASYWENVVNKADWAEVSRRLALRHWGKK